MSEAKEGKLLGRKKLLDPHLGTTEGTKITSTIIFYTSHALTVYSSDHRCIKSRQNRLELLRSVDSKGGQMAEATGCLAFRRETQWRSAGSKDQLGTGAEA